MTSDSISLTIPQTATKAVPVHHGIEMSWDEFASLGVLIIDQTRQLFLGLGHLALWGWDRFCPGKSQRAWEAECAAAWGCARSTVNKAISLSRSPVALPRDQTPSWNYVAVSFGKGDAAKTEEIIEFGLTHGLSAFNLRIFCILRDEDLTTELTVLRLYRSGDNLIVQDGDKTEVFARLVNGGPLSGAGARLLTLKAGF